MSEIWYAYWLACVEGITGDRKWELCRKTGSAEAVYYIEEKGISEFIITEKEWKILKESKKKRNWKEAYQRVADQGIRMAVRGQENYPKRLEELAGMPYALFFIGEMPQEEIASVAVVGARRCSNYGEKMTLRFVERLAENGIQIISGMALGIDGMAHRGALNVGGKTFAVLGGGADVCYPGAHKGLYKDLVKRGGVLSEQPPGTPPVAWHFPARNRLISGLADVVLVMEAKEKSGSLITADMALEQGRDIYALPGMVTEPLSCGCNRLIRQGAGILLGEEDLLEELVIKGMIKKKIAKMSDMKNKIKLETKENLVYSKLGLYPRGLDDLQRETGLTPQEVMGICVSLQLKGCIQERSKNYYVRAK